MTSWVGRRALQCAALCALLALFGHPFSARAQGQGVAGGSDVVLNSAVRADSNSYRINFSEGSNQGIRLSGVNDIDGDGRTDFLMGTLLYESSEGWSGVMYLVAAADLAGADAADGTTDRVVDSSYIAAQPNSWKLTGEHGYDLAGRSLAQAGDGDGLSELLIGAPAFPNGRALGAAYLLSLADLEAADAADGSADGVISLQHVAAQPNSWKFTGEKAGDLAGQSVASLGDINADGTRDFAIGAPGREWANEDSAGAIYLVSGGDLTLADAEDGFRDGHIELANVASQQGSWKLVGEWLDDNVGGIPSTTYVDEGGELKLIVAAPGSLGDKQDNGGTIYLLAANDLRTADKADRVADGVVDLGNVAAQSKTWRFRGAANDRARYGVSPGDYDADGVPDLIIRTVRTVYFLSGEHLHEADASDGDMDRVIHLPHTDAPNMWTVHAPYFSINSGGVQRTALDSNELGYLALQDRSDAYLFTGPELTRVANRSDWRLDELVSAGSSLRLTDGYTPVVYDAITDLAFLEDMETGGRGNLLVGAGRDVFVLGLAELVPLDSRVADTISIPTPQCELLERAEDYFHTPGRTPERIMSVAASVSAGATAMGWTWSHALPGSILYRELDFSSARQSLSAAEWFCLVDEKTGGTLRLQMYPSAKHVFVGEVSE